jgi:AraC family transcriptional regulator
VSAVSVARVRYGSGFRQTRHADDRIQISVVLDGRLVERVGSRDERAGPLSLVVKARGVEHADDYGSSGVLIGSLALEGNEGERLLDGAAAIPDWLWSNVSPALRSMLRLVDRVPGARGAFEADDPDVLDVLAAVTSTAPGRASRVPPAWIAQVREQFDDGELGRVRTVAARAGVHPVYLARAFRRWFGCSVSAYLRHTRVARSAGLLTGDTSLTHVAATAGFSDHPHFCHRFRDATGLTPGRYRALASRSRPAVDLPPHRAIQ